MNGPDSWGQVKIYETAFGLGRLFLHEAGDYGELDTGATKLAFSSRKLMAELGKQPGVADPKAPVFELAFETGDVPAALARALSAGAVLVQGAELQPCLSNPTLAERRSRSTAHEILNRDFDAVKSAIDMLWSNGQAEGQINRLKTLKRAMYGRAGPELLHCCARECYRSATQIEAEPR